MFDNMSRRIERLSPRDVKTRVTENLNTLVSRFDSVSAASKAFGINRQQLNKYLSGARTPSLLTAAKISDVCNVQIDFLIDGAGGRTPVGAGARPPAPSRKHHATVPPGAADMPAVQRDSIKAMDDAEFKATFAEQFVFYMRSPLNGQFVMRGTFAIEAVTGFGRFCYCAPNPSFVAKTQGRPSIRGEGRYITQNRVFLLTSALRSRDEGAVFISAVVRLAGRNVRYGFGRAVGAWEDDSRYVFTENVAVKRLYHPLGRAELYARCGMIDMNSSKVPDTLLNVLRSLPETNGSLPL